MAGSRSTSSGSRGRLAPRRKRVACCGGDAPPVEHVRRRRRVGVVRRRGGQTRRPPPKCSAPLDKDPATVRRGESVRVEVVVRTRKVGHFSPAGRSMPSTSGSSSRRWTTRGACCCTAARFRRGQRTSGPGAHFYRSLQLDEHGNPINKRNAWMTRSVAYVRLIPPGAADTVHYRLQIPTDAATRFSCARRSTTASSRGGTRSGHLPVSAIRRSPIRRSPVVRRRPVVFTGDTSRVSGKIKAIPDIPMTVMARHGVAAVIDATRRCRTVKPFMDPSVRERWNDYGIGLLLQGDLRSARRHF